MPLASIANLLILLGLIAVMLSMGLAVKFEDVLASARKPRLVVSGLLANFLLIPVCTIGLLRVYDPDPMVSAGFPIFAACPRAPVAPPFTALARAAPPRRIRQMGVLAGLSVLASAPTLLVTR